MLKAASIFCLDFWIIEIRMKFTWYSHKYTTKNMSKKSIATNGARIPPPAATSGSDKPTMAHSGSAGVASSVLQGVAVGAGSEATKAANHSFRSKDSCDGGWFALQVCLKGNDPLRCDELRVAFQKCVTNTR